MNAGLTIGGVHIALQAPTGPLEVLACTAYDWYLGTIRRPTCWLTLSALRERRDVDDRLITEADGRSLRLSHPWFEAEIGEDYRVVARVLPKAPALDTLLTALLGLIAPTRGTLLVAGAGVILGADGHLLVGRTGAAVRGAGEQSIPILNSMIVALVEMDGWQISGTPFGGCRLQRTAPLRSIWCVDNELEGPLDVQPISGADCASVVMDHSVRPHTSLYASEFFSLAAEVGGSVPAGRIASGTIDWARIGETAKDLHVRRALSSPRPQFRERMLKDFLPRITGSH